MAGMPRATPAVGGFSVYQPALGSPLQFLPAVGSKELEQLVGAYLPGPGSAQEKRAAISMDFFEHSRQTGENFKYYAVVTPAATPESAYNVSPVMSDLSFYSSPSQASTPAVAPAPTKSRAASQKPKTSASAADFSHLPGMKILTADGQDVTNSVSRGCKSKEQRDHAHLMRILKACDACKKKKVKCDPSHKKRPASQVESRSEAAKPAKKSRKAAAPSPKAHSTVFTPATEASFQMDSLGPSSVDFSSSIDEPWDQFLTFNDEPVGVAVPQDFYGAIPQDFDLFFGVDNSFSPSFSGSSASSSTQPLTPVSSGLLTHANDFSFNEDDVLVLLSGAGNSQEPNLPYLNPAGQLGSNYADFNLFSPASSFIDEEPQLLKSGPSSQAQSPAGMNEQLPGTGLARDQQSRFERPQSQSRSVLSPSSPQQRVPGRGQAAGLASELSGSLAYHPDDAGHNTARSVNAVTRPQGLQTTRSHTISGAQQVPAVSFSEDSGPSRQSSTSAVSPSVLSQGSSLRSTGQDATPARAGVAHASSQAISPTENRYIDPGRYRPDLPDLPDLSDVAHSRRVSSVAGVSSRSGSTGSLGLQTHGLSSRAGSTSQDGLPSGLSLLSHAPQVPTSSIKANATVGLSQVTRTSVAGPCLSESSPALACQNRGLGSANVNAELPLQGVVLSPGLAQHPKPAPNPARLLSSQHSAPLSSPARQLLVPGGSSSLVLPSQLAASGFVSMLLSLLMVVVVVTTLHQPKTQRQAQPQDILAGLPSIAAAFLALMSTAAPVSTLPQQKRSGGILGRARGFLSPLARVVPLISSYC
ncbi:hypothetical protein KVR01_002285 [Diaporthe batatas]|uniref:uncharacterized protein n=1 Tax=Diaporthe batatas TaxID=748121 RepID=UPI001D0408B4|nr:uncharacterized protein KVR01_002285 [Diaporthe batatas]KAG8166596.1 hypothetical protein KVR01_002285 [Diaporthe batatas]